jgi:hypothetical protein
VAAEEHLRTRFGSSDLRLERDNMSLDGCAGLSESTSGIITPAQAFKFVCCVFHTLVKPRLATVAHLLKA